MADYHWEIYMAFARFGFLYSWIQGISFMLYRNHGPGRVMISYFPGVFISMFTWMSLCTILIGFDVSAGYPLIICTAYGVGLLWIQVFHRVYPQSVRLRTRWSLLEAGGILLVSAFLPAMILMGAGLLVGASGGAASVRQMGRGSPIYGPSGRYGIFK